jgi:hypothetical protein
MGFMDKAKGMLGKNKNKVEGGIDTAADQAKDKLGGKVDAEHIDGAADQAKDAVDKLSDDR